MENSGDNFLKTRGGGGEELWYPKKDRFGVRNVITFKNGVIRSLIFLSSIF